MPPAPPYPTAQNAPPLAPGPVGPAYIGVEQSFAVIAKTHLRLGDIDAAAATLGRINDGSARLQALRELVGPSGTGSPVAPGYVMPSPPGLPLVLIRPHRSTVRRVPPKLSCTNQHGRIS